MSSELFAPHRDDDSISAFSGEEFLPDDLEKNRSSATTRSTSTGIVSTTTTEKKKVVSFFGEKQEEPSRSSALPSPIKNDFSKDDDAEYVGADQRFSLHKLGNVHVEDHFSLPRPSSDLTYQLVDRHTFPLGTNSIVLTRSNNDQTVTVKYYDNTTVSQLLFRGICTLLAVLMVGFLFAFFLEVILFLFLGLVIESGMNTTTSFAEAGIMSFLGTVFAIPVLVRGMSNAMSIAAAFIKNTWDAQQYMKTILASDGIVVEWLSVGIFLFVPFLTLSISLFSGWDEWYSLTLTTWFMSIFVFYLFFTVVVIYFEISGAWELLSNGHDDLFDPERDLTSFRKICTGCRILIHMRMVQKLAVKEKITYVVDGSHVQPVEEDYGISTAHKGATSYIGPYARLTRLVCLRCGWFQTLKEPKREFHQNEIDDILPFIARRTWSLGSMHLQNVNAPLQGAIVDGKAALTELQIYSSFGFELLIFGIKIIILYSCLNWLGWGITTVSITVAVYGVIYLLWVVRPSLATKLLLRRKGIRKKNDDIVDSVKHGHRSNRLGKSIIGFIGILRKSTKTVALSERENKAFAVNKVVYRIAEPSEKLCWVILCLEVACFYIFPSISLFVSKNNFVAILFSGIGIVTIFRDHFSPSVLLKDFGSLDSLEKDDSNRNTEWRKKHRINKVAREIGAGSNTRFFQRLFLVFITVYCFLFLSAVVIETDSGRAFGWAYTYDFEYPGSKHDIQYPTCQLSQGIPPLQDTPTSLADIAFLAGLSYETSEVVEDSLQTWFGSSSNVIYHQDVVTEFRKEFESINVESAVEYKFVGFPDADVGIISIRGTENLWDILTDVQLWGGAAIIQCVRFVIPFGSWFNPILERINKTFSSIESSTLAKISFYRQTTKFVEYLQQSTDMYSNYIITGHSLGGGLAMISGAQLQVPSIAISGVNTLISRETFDPPISEEDLDKYTLNIIPDRDLVPMIDDPAQNYQRINCSAPRNDPFNCHLPQRSVCEILFTCGSNGRPIPCHCVEIYGYEEPVPSATYSGISFADVCENVSKG